MTKSNKLTLWIFIAMVLGIGLGAWYRSAYPDEASLKAFGENISILTDIFLRLVKMIIAPLVLSTLIVGVAKLGDLKSVGRIGGRALLWFISASLMSLLLGMFLVNLFEPGVSLGLPLPDATASSGVEGVEFTLRNFITHVFPKSIVEAMANNEILQIVIFALMVGVACAALGEKGAPIVNAMDSLGHVMLKVTGMVMNVAPFAVFAAMAAVISQKGLSILGTYGKFIGQFYFGLLLLWCLLMLVCYLIIGRRTGTLISRIKDPLLLAFSTASSEAAFPRTMEQLERFGCPNRIVSFILPLGYSFNLDGSMMYMTFASLFIAQAYGIDLSASQQITMLLVLMVTSKGIAGVPRASLVVIAGTLAMFNIPEAGLLLLLGVDHLLDMGRSATNVVGNAVATVVVSKWEGMLEK
ncbi:MAG: dicarboxylate/amino acid:cation symporter [Flavobacteriales bacterium]|nr:dicarboxylate/amino acid:cation symporter [Flavobacteriales bacterium]MBK7554658.1 dicarboxylate/amino acid:cation symporter [Flavobacteriales bacterium]MBK9193553.1 dicarboxylate/amino acid:cation symporter [Flavobacteriales bacterium]MBP6573387.1 dicarboxylate/amino acid:cation symporter [Flavobacteriales bacterium]